VARSVTFNPYITNVVGPLQELLQDPSTGKKGIAKVEQIFGHITSGITANKSVVSDSLLLFVDSIVRGNTDPEIDARVEQEKRKGMSYYHIIFVHLSVAALSAESGLAKPVADTKAYYTVEPEPTMFYRPALTNRTIDPSSSIHIAVEFALALLHIWYVFSSCIDALYSF